MDAKDHPLISVLGDQRRFVVPVYQRQYSWKDDRLSSFWDDVVAKAEEALDGKPKFGHYMGALILSPGGDGFTIGTTPKVQVVDGQQRLTTFQIFLSALRDVGTDLGEARLGDLIRNYLFVQPMSGDVGPDAKFKLIPTPDDRKVFHLIVDGGMAAVRENHATLFYRNGRLKKGIAPLPVCALDFFIERIHSYVRYGLQDDGSADFSGAEVSREETSKRLSALVEALLNHLKLVVITLSESDDAQVIFETLNSKSEPLLAMDLVRNNIFHRASALGESAEELFEQKWHQFNDLFWKADAPRAKPRRPRIDHFLSHALTAQSGEEISLRELYSEYRAFTRPKGKPRFPTVEAELGALTLFAPTYRALEDGAGTDIDLNRLGIKLNLWEVSTAYPLVFLIATSSVEQNIKRTLYNLIYSYIVRRAICGLTSKGMNKTFVRLVSLMLQHGVSTSTFENAFSGQRTDTVRFPDDNELIAAIIKSPIYSRFPRKERLTDILWELELKSRTKYVVNAPRPPNISIEHILPQKWTKNWLLRDGRMAPDDHVSGVDETMNLAIAGREAALQTLGNLTLITVPGNSSASNLGFTEKRIWLKQSLLGLNLKVEENQTWDENTIAARANTLATLAINVWPNTA